jgi:ribosomal protein L40E
MVVFGGSLCTVIYIAIFKKWYEAKKPTLQAKVLKHIALDGELSKTKGKKELHLSKNYSDISEAFKGLQKRKLIKHSHFDFKSRRAEQFYKLTDKGMEVFICENQSPADFWRAMKWFCRLNDRSIDWNRFDGFYNNFATYHLVYWPEHGYFPQLDFFDKLFNKWMENNGKINRDGSINHNFFHKITISQKVLECLALHGPLTSQELIAKLHKNKGRIVDDEPFYTDLIEIAARDSEQKKELEREHLGAVYEEDIEKVIDDYTLSPEYLREYNSDVSDQYELIEKYLDLISHLIIIRKLENNVVRYELSLIGIFLVLAIISYDYYGYHRGIFLPLDRYYDYIEPKDYCETIALRNQNKLPLIFGKWDLLKDAIAKKRLSDLDEPKAIIALIFQNFLFNKESRIDNISSPVSIGGFREFHDNVQALAQRTTIKLNEIYEDLENEYDEYGAGDKSDELFYRKLNDIGDLLVMRDLRRFIDALDNKLNENSIMTEVLPQIERIYADELTFLFFLTIGGGLYTKGVDSSYGWGYHSLRAYPVSNISQRYFSTKYASSLLQPSAILLWILQNDEEIRNWFYPWIKDSLEYQKEVFDIMSRYHNDIIGKNQLVCQQCGVTNSIDSKLCKSCNGDLRISCHKCGSTPPYQSSFCNRCGFALMTYRSRVQPTKYD